MSGAMKLQGMPPPALLCELHFPPLLVLRQHALVKQVRESKVIFEVHHFSKYQSSCMSKKTTNRHFIGMQELLVKGFHKICMNSLYICSKKRTDISQKIIFLCHLWQENIDQSFLNSCFASTETVQKALR